MTRKKKSGGLFGESIPIPEFKDVYKDELVARGNWVIAALEGGVHWPTDVHKVNFRDQVLFIIPQTNETPPTVSVELGRTGGDFAAGQVLISHFLSSLTWVTHQGIAVTGWSGGSQCNPVRNTSHQRFHAITHDFHHPYLPDPREQKTRWALAFFREGLSLNHIAYQCLSFFKVLNIFLGNSRKQKDWMSQTALKLMDHQAVERLSELGAIDIGDYLYGSGRCAVAHAGDDPTIDPENPHDLRRMYQDLPLIRALAEYAIEYEFGVKSLSTVWREHLYELEGFRRIFGDEHVASIKITGSLDKAYWPELPKLSIRLHSEDCYPPLEKMNSEILGIDNGSAIVRCQSPDKLTNLMIGLNFVEERLEINFPYDPTSGDNGSAHAMKQAVHASEFWLDYFLNGELEVWDSDHEIRLGRCDPFVPENVDMMGTVRSQRKRIDHFTSIGDRRARFEKGITVGITQDVFQGTHSQSWPLPTTDFPLTTLLRVMKSYLIR